jgi:hypothetical protein
VPQVLFVGRFGAQGLAGIENLLGDRAVVPHAIFTNVEREEVVAIAIGADARRDRAR